MANAEINLGDVLLAQGDLHAAAELFAGVEHMARDAATSPWKRFRYSNRLWASMGELALAQGDLDAARARAQQCLELATQTTARKNLVKGWRLSGAIAVVARRWDEAHQALNEALVIAKTIGNPTQLWQTYAALGHYHAQLARKTPPGPRTSPRAPSSRAYWSGFRRRGYADHSRVLLLCATSPRGH